MKLSLVTILKLSDGGRSFNALFTTPLNSELPELLKTICCEIIFLISIPVFANDLQREIEYEAINLVIQKYGKGLSNRLKGTGLNPSYRSWYENECFVSVAAGTYQEYNWSAMKWFSVNTCLDSAEILEAD